MYVIFFEASLSHPNLLKMTITNPGSYLYYVVKKIYIASCKSNFIKQLL